MLKLAFSSLLPQGPQQGVWARVGGKREGRALSFRNLCGSTISIGFQQHVGNNRPTEKQHHGMPVEMLPLAPGPSANLTTSEWKIPNISFGWCRIALGRCRKTEALKHFNGLNESWPSFLNLVEQCNIFFFLFVFIFLLDKLDSLKKISRKV